MLNELLKLENQQLTWIDLIDAGKEELEKTTLQFNINPYFISILYSLTIYQKLKK